MDSRERLNAAIHHQPVDHLCVDFGAGAQTGIGVCAVWNLRKALLDDDSPVKVTEPYQMLGEVDEDLRQALGLDVVGIHPRINIFGYPNEDWKPFKMHDGTPILVPGKFNTTVNERGAVLLYPEGDLSVPPSAKMPKGSYFFDSIPRQKPLDEDNMDPADNCEEFGLLGEEDVSHFVDNVKSFYDQTNYGIYVTLPGLALGDICLVPAPWMKNPRGIRGVPEWYISLASHQDYIMRIFECQCEFALKNIETLAAALGDMPQVAFVSGTDFAHQSSQFCSNETFREMYGYFYKQMNDRIHQLTKWKTFMHCCGAVSRMIPEFIEAGFDILNPVQCSAAGMDPRQLKQEYGQDIVFWGGGVDTQSTLPFGTPDEVYREVSERIEIFSEGSGFVFNSTHNIQSNVPVDNILAMFRAVNDSRA